MKKSLLTTAAVCSLLLALATGCREENGFLGSDSGRVRLGLDFNAEPVTITSQIGSRAGSLKSSVTVDDLQLTLSSNEREWEKSYSSIAEFQAEESFPTGDYTLEAYYGSDKDEGHGKPYYFGETTFTIQNQQTTEVSLPVYLANSVVDIKVTDAFTKFMTAYSFSLVSTAGKSHTWFDEAEEDLYVVPGTTKVLISFTKPNGVSAENVQVAVFTAKPRHRHTVTIDYNGGEVGGSEALTIDVDDAVEEEDAILDISDDIIVHSAPTLVADGFVTGSSFEIIDGCPHFDILAVNAVARGGIQKVILTTESRTLTEKNGFPAEVDLCAPGEYAAVLDKFKLKTRGLSGGVMGVVDFIDFIGMIPYVENGSDADNTSKFTLSVVDSYGKEAPNKIKFGITVTPLDFELLSAKFTKFGNVVVEFRFNGDHDHIDHGLHFYRNNSRGIEEEVKITSCSDEKHSEDIHIAELSYSYKNFIEDAGRWVIARTGQFESNKVDVTVNHGNPELRILDKPENVFATKAILTLENATEQKGYFQLSTDGDTFEDYNNGAVVNGTDSNFTLTGLKPNTTYWVRADVGDAISRTKTFTTEAATPLTNGKLENSSTVSEGTYWKEYAFAGWQTNNNMTTHSESGSGWVWANYTYVRNSGTVPLESGRSGKGVNIRTIGWGKGNTAAVASGFGTCHYVTPGELFLGEASYNDHTPTNTYGIGWSSRPASVSFYYKYSTVTANNGDFGTAEITIRLSDGTIITKSQELIVSNDWKLETLTLSYPLGSAKADSITVAFKSSGNPDCQVADAKYMTPPPPMNLSNGEYLGSQLWIDEVTLNY